MSTWDRVVAAFQRWPKLTVPLGVAVAVAGAALAPRIPLSTDATEHLPRVTPAVGYWLDLSRRFDAFNSLIIGLEEPQAPFTAEGLDHLKRVTAKLASLKASGVLSVSSLANVDSIREGEDGSLETELLVPEVPKDAAALKALSARVAADVQVSGALISRDQRGYLVLVRADPRKDAAELARKVEQTVEAERGPLTASYFGAPFISAVITRGVYARLTWLVPLFLLLFLGTLTLLGRRWPVIGLVLCCVALALGTWAAIVRALGLVLSFTSLTALLVLAVVAAVAFARGLELRAAEGRPEANPFPARVAAALAAAGLGALALKGHTIGFLPAFGVTMAVGALSVLVVGLLVFAPLAAHVAPFATQPPGRPRAPGLGLALAAVVTLGAGAVASRAHFFATPQGMFGPDDQVGRSLAFFDRRFGGPDFIQVDYQGDLRDPDVAARLLRLTDLLEGAEGVTDVRTVAQILGFLNHGFGGLHRVPTSRESLGNLWFFLEGRSDVRNLASDARDEAMGVIRVPSRPAVSVALLAGEVDRAIADSLLLGKDGARLRLAALGRVFKVELPPAKVDEVLAAAVAPMPEADRVALQTEVTAKLQRWLASNDSPYQPTDEEWARLREALAAPASERSRRLAEVAASFTALDDPKMQQQLVETVLAREKDFALSVHALGLAQRLVGPEAPEALRVRAQGVLADVLDPHVHPGDAAKVTVTGLPVVSPELERGLMLGLWKALALLVVLGAFVMGALLRKPLAAVRAVVEATVATVLTLALAGALGLGVDSGSATLFLLPPVVALLASNGPAHSRLTTAFMLALAVADLALLTVGLLPVARIGAAVAIGLGAVAAVSAASRRFRVESANGRKTA